MTLHGHETRLFVACGWFLVEDFFFREHHDFVAAYTRTNSSVLNVKLVMNHQPLLKTKKRNVHVGVFDCRKQLYMLK